MIARMARTQCLEKCLPRQSSRAAHPCPLSRKFLRRENVPYFVLRITNHALPLDKLVSRLECGKFCNWRRFPPFVVPPFYSPAGAGWRGFQVSAFLDRIRGYAIVPYGLP